MTIVDFHLHGAKINMWTPWVHEYMKQINPALYKSFDKNMTPEKLLALMDNQGVDYAVVLAEIAPLTTGLVKNEFIIDFCEKRNRLIPFACLDPVTDADPPKTLSRLVEDRGMKGLKLLPPYQHFYPNDKKFHPLYAKAQELDVPVVFHTGSSVFTNAKLKFGNPLYLDDLAVDFPDLTIVQAHGGRPFWYDIAFFLARRHRNVYIDISGLPPKNLLRYFPELEKIGDKVIFGSDWPGVASVKANVEAIQKLPLGSGTKRKILGENAVRLLKL